MVQSGDLKATGYAGSTSLAELRCVPLVSAVAPDSGWRVR